MQSKRLQLHTKFIETVYNLKIPKNLNIFNLCILIAVSLDIFEVLLELKMQLDYVVCTI